MERHVLQNSGSKDDAKDLYQNTLIAFYKNVCKEDFTLTVQIKTYIHSIARNLWLKVLRDRKNKFSNDIDSFDIEDNDSSDFLEKEVLLDKMSFALKQISDNCQQLIRLFHYQSKSWTEIVSILGYKNEHAARNQKYKCLQKLKAEMK